MNITPVGKNLHIKKLESETVTPGGIHLTTPNAQYNKARVISVGPSEQITVSPGMIILLPANFKSIEIDHDEHIIDVSNVLAIVEDQE